MSINQALDPEEIASFIIDGGYPDYIHPLSCILTGSRAYGINNLDSDYDYIGIHLADTTDLLEHPNFRPNLQVIRKRFDKDFQEIHTHELNSVISLDSYELWKFLDLVLKGAPVVYEILYMPEIHHDNNFGGLITSFREAINNKIGITVQGLARNNIRNRHNKIKSTVFAYYKLIQTIVFLRDQDYIWNINELLEFIPTNIRLFSKYLSIYQNNRTYILKDLEKQKVNIEIESLIEEVNKAIIASQLPNETPDTVLSKVLRQIKQIRFNWI